MARCKFGKVKFGDRKGKCRTRKVSGAAAKHRKARKLTGAAARAKECAGKKGGFFRQCIRGIVAPGPTASSLYGMRRRRSR